MLYKERANDLNKRFDSEPHHLREELAFNTIKAYEEALKYGDGPSDRSAIMSNIAVLCKKACKWEKSKGSDRLENAFYW